MVERIDATFKALADPTRRAMLASLALGERSIGELAQPFAISFEGASKHVRMLERAGLVTRRIEGRVHRLALSAGPLAEAEAWLKQWERFWTERIDLLDALIKADRAKAANDGETK